MADDIILRKGFTDDELVTVTQFTKEFGTSVTSFRSRQERYADRAPKPVRIRMGHAKLYVRKELEDFCALPVGRKRPRPREEVLQSRIHRLKETVTASEERERKRREDWEKAILDLKNHQRQLQRAKEDLELLLQKNR